MADEFLDINALADQVEDCIVEAGLVNSIAGGHINSRAGRVIMLLTGQLNETEQRQVSIQIAQALGLRVQYGLVGKQRCLIFDDLIKPGAKVLRFDS